MKFLSNNDLREKLFLCAAICLLIPVAVYAGYDRWIWSVPYEHRRTIFMFGWWLTHVSTALGGLLSISGRRTPRIVYIVFSIGQFYALNRLFVIA